MSTETEDFGLCIPEARSLFATEKSTKAAKTVCLAAGGLALLNLPLEIDDELRVFPPALLVLHQALLEFGDLLSKP